MTTYARKQFAGSLFEAGADTRQVNLVVDEILGDQIIATFTDGDTTPSVAVPNALFMTANTGATTISDLDDGFSGQIVTVVFGDANTTVDFTASGLVGNGGADWTPSANDSMRCVYDGTDWYCAISQAGGGSGVSVSGTPADGQVAVWTAADTIEGDSDFTWTDTTGALSIGHATGPSGLIINADSGGAGAGTDRNAYVQFLSDTSTFQLEAVIGHTRVSDQDALANTLFAADPGDFTIHHVGYSGTGFAIGALGRTKLRIDSTSVYWHAYFSPTTRYVRWQDSGTSGEEWHWDFTSFDDWRIQGLTDGMYLDGSLWMEEKAAAAADTATYGQIWVEDDVANRLKFTNDAGADWPLQSVHEAEYAYSSTVTAGDPGAYTLRFDSITIGSIANMYIDDLSLSEDWDWVLSNLADGDIISIKSAIDAADYIIASVNGTPTDGTGYWTVPLTLIHTGTIFTDGDPLRIEVQWFSQGGSGDVTKVGTPVDNQVGVWTGDGTIEGHAGFTYDSSTRTLSLLDGTYTDYISFQHDGVDANIDTAGADKIHITGTNYLDVEDGAELRVFEATNTNYTRISTIGSTLGHLYTTASYLELTATTGIRTAASKPFYVRGGSFLVQDGSATEYIQFAHDGTDVNITHSASTVDWNITGINGFNVVNYNFDVDQTVGVGQDNYVLTYDNTSGLISLEAATGGTPTDITVANEATDTTCFPLFVTAATGDLGPKSNAGLTFDSSTSNLSSTLIAGITSTDLVDKSDTETVSGSWTFSANPVIENALPYLYMRDTNATADEGNWIITAANDNFGIATATDAAPGTVAATIMQIQRSGTAGTNIVWDANTFILSDSTSLRIRGATSTHYVNFDHDDTDLNITAALTTDINLTGITAINAGTVDADFDAITATSYGGITEANLVDKSATETISGAWTHSGATVCSTSLNAVPLARNITATTNTATTDYGIVIRMTSGSGATFTLDGDPPTNAVVLLDNSSGNSWTIAASTSLIWAADATTGNRTLADDGLAVAIHRGSGTWIINGSDLLT